MTITSKWDRESEILDNTLEFPFWQNEALRRQWFRMEVVIAGAKKRV